jgi:hypothetical protein
LANQRPQEEEEEEVGGGGFRPDPTVPPPPPPPPGQPPLSAGAASLHSFRPIRGPDGIAKTDQSHGGIAQLDQSRGGVAEPDQSHRLGGNPANGRAGVDPAKGRAGGDGLLWATPAFKCVEVVRKKRDREALHGWDCDCCRGFYEAVCDTNRLTVYTQ